MFPIESISTGETYGEWPEAEVEELKLAMTKAFGVAYISGPMSGLPELNYPAFFAAEDRVKDQYSKVLNPARLALDKGLHFGLNIPKVIAWNSWFVIKYWHNRYVSFTLPFLRK